jgi:hypothetical protein
MLRESFPTWHESFTFRRAGPRQLPCLQRLVHRLLDPRAQRGCGRHPRCARLRCPSQCTRHRREGRRQRVGIHHPTKRINRTRRRSSTAHVRQHRPSRAAGSHLIGSPPPQAATSSILCRPRGDRTAVASRPCPACCWQLTPLRGSAIDCALSRAAAASASGGARPLPHAPRA